MSKRRLVIATRESPLAMQQAKLIQAALSALYPQLNIEIKGFTTTGDRFLEAPLADVGGKGLFVKELEEALYAKTVDIAVHSMKDMPMDLPPGLTLGAICQREDPRDAFVANDYQSLMQLPQQAIVGTASLRRQTQLLALRSDLIMKNLRGNIQTRLKKLDQGEFAAIILASAGLKRMQLASRIKSYLSTDDVLPSAGQGALGIECRLEDTELLALIAPLNHTETALLVQAERALCRTLGGGCKVPLAAFAEMDKGNIYLRGLVVSADGKRRVYAELRGPLHEADNLGQQVGNRLKQKGAQKILAEFQ